MIFLFWPENIQKFIKKSFYQKFIKNDQKFFFLTFFLKNKMCRRAKMNPDDLYVSIFQFIFDKFEKKYPNAFFDVSKNQLAFMFISIKGIIYSPLIPPMGKQEDYLLPQDFSLVTQVKLQKHNGLHNSLLGQPIF